MIKLLAAAAMLSGQAASPPPPPSCVSRQQLGDIALVGWSLVIDGVREACRPHLAASAFLIQPAGADYLARLRAEAERRLDSTIRLFASFFGSGPVPADAVRAVVQTIFTAGPAEGGIGPLDRPLCREFDEMTEAMSPMSLDQSARFNAATYSMMQQLEARTAALRAAAAPAAAEGDAAVPEPAMPPIPPICPE